MATVEIYETERDLLATVDQELDREYEMKMDSVPREDLEDVLSKIRAWFEDLQDSDLEEINEVIKEMFAGLEDDIDDLPVIIFMFDQQGEQVDLFTGYPDFWSGCPQNWYTIYL